MVTFSDDIIFLNTQKPLQEREIQSGYFLLHGEYVTIPHTMHHLRWNNFMDLFLRLLSKHSDDKFID